MVMKLCWFDQGFNGEFQLFCGVDDVAKDWDDENFYVSFAIPFIVGCQVIVF